MKRVVLHPSAFADWFEDGGTRLRTEFEAGQLDVIVPISFVADALGAGEPRLVEGAPRPCRRKLRRIGFRLMEPPASALAEWLVRGVSAPVANRAALASWLDIRIAASDDALRKALKTLPQAL